MRGFFRNTPAPRESAGPQGKGPLAAEIPHFKCHIESDDCLLDPRRIDPSFPANAPRLPLAWPLARAARDSGRQRAAR